VGGPGKTSRKRDQKGGRPLGSPPRKLRTESLRGGKRLEKAQKGEQDRVCETARKKNRRGRLIRKNNPMNRGGGNFRGTTEFERERKQGEEVGGFRGRQGDNKESQTPSKNNGPFRGWRGVNPCSKKPHQKKERSLGRRGHTEREGEVPNKDRFRRIRVPAKAKKSKQMKKKSGIFKERPERAELKKR